MQGFALTNTMGDTVALDGNGKTLPHQVMPTTEKVTVPTAAEEREAANRVDANGWTPLMHAVYKGDLQVHKKKRTALLNTLCYIMFTPC